MKNFKRTILAVLASLSICSNAHAIYVHDDPANGTDPSGRTMVVPDPKDRPVIQNLINSRAQGKYRVNPNTGKISKVSSTGKYSQRSSYYAGKLDHVIASKSSVSVDIAGTYTTDQGQSVDVDNVAGGGLTDLHANGDVSVVVSGNPNMSLTNTHGAPLRDLPADILGHEIVAHAAPLLGSPDTGNAVQNENKMRAQIPGGDQRAPEPTSEHPE